VIIDSFIADPNIDNIRGRSRISEGGRGGEGVLIVGTDSSVGDTDKFSRGCLQRFVSTNLNAYISSGAGFKNFRGHLLVKTKKKVTTFSIDKC